MHYFRTETQDLAQNLVDDFFFLTLTEKKKSEENMSVRGYFMKKRKPCMQNLMKERNQPPEALLQQLIFDIRFIRCL